MQWSVAVKLSEKNTISLRGLAVPFLIRCFLPHPSAPVSLDTLSSLLSLQVDKVIDQVKEFQCQAVKLMLN